MKAFPQIFISYRREDSAGWAGRIADLLITAFGRQCVFFDIESIHPGSDFVRSLKQRTAGCDALLVVIGKDWLNVRDQQGKRRLDDPNDLVRIEISAALRRDVRVIPLLVADAEMPEASELPAELAPLAQRNAARITDTSFRQTMAGLITVLMDEGTRRRFDGPAPHGAGSHVEDLWYRLTVADVLNNVARRAANVYPWMQSHKLIALALILLAVLTFSPLWYPSANRPSRITGSSVAKIADGKSSMPPIIKNAPLQDAKTEFRSFFLVIRGEAPFDVRDLAAEIKNNPEFGNLKLEITDEPALANAFLELSHPALSEFLFELKSPDTAAVLLSGRVEVADGVPVTAMKVAAEMVKGLKTWRSG